MLRNAIKNEQGTSAVEFALTAPAFFAIVFAIIEIGLVLWTQQGLQHGAELAARCATVNSTTCGSASTITAYAAQQAYGLGVTASVFSYSTPACGNQVSASYPFQFLTSYFSGASVTLTAQSCFPK